MYITYFFSIAASAILVKLVLYLLDISNKKYPARASHYEQQRSLHKHWRPNEGERRKMCAVFCRVTRLKRS